MQLPEQSNHLILCRRGVAFLFIQGIPEFLYLALTVHQSDEAIGSWSKSVGSPAGMILQHEPDLASVIVTVQLCMLT